MRICKFSPQACLQQCNSANQKHLHKETHNHSAVFQRQVKGTSPCPWERVKKPWQSPEHCKSSRSWLGSIALCIISPEIGHAHVQKHNWHCPEQAWSETASQNRLNSVILKSYGNLRRNGVCPHEGKRVHRSTFSKHRCMLRQDLWLLNTEVFTRGSPTQPSWPSCCDAFVSGEKLCQTCCTGNENLAQQLSDKLQRWNM